MKSIRVSNLVFCCSLFFFHSTRAFGQFSAYMGVGELRDTGKSVPNPKSTFRSFGLLRNPDVVNELGLTNSQRAEAVAILQETNGVPAVVMVRNSALEGLSEADTLLLFASIRADRQKRVDSLLTEDQKKRLSNIVYQYEIARIGYKEAILNGFLGQDAQIDPSQRAELSAAFEKIESDVLNESWVALEVSARDVLALLTESQRKKLLSILGKPFRHPLSVRETRTAIGTEPNPESLVEISVFLENEAVYAEIKLDINHSELIQKARSIQDKKEANAQLFEILLPSQTTRLREIAFQFEILRRGLVQSLANGFTGKAIDINESQRKALLKQPATVDVRTIDLAKQIDNATRSRFLSILTKPQQERANNLLGEFFLVVE